MPQGWPQSGQFFTYITIKLLRKSCYVYFFWFWRSCFTQQRVFIGFIIERERLSTAQPSAAPSTA
jgi:hypothetical protein